jgi:glycine oxidase
MLGATAETTFTEADRAVQHRLARREWDPFLNDLSSDLDRPISYASTSTIALGLNRSDHVEIEHLATFQRSLGLAIEPLDRTALDHLVPGLGRTLRRGFHFVDDAAVDNRGVLQALLDACSKLGGHLVTTSVESVRRDHNGFTLTTPEGPLSAQQVLLATGAAPMVTIPMELPKIHPVAGVIVRLSPRPSTLRLHTTIRAVVNGRSCYLVPRPSGELVLGATSVERGFDLGTPAGELHQLLEDGRSVFPSLDDYEVSAVEVGLRPTTADHQPVVEVVEPGVIVALGHYRNGFLLAPSTASRVANLARGSMT